jgi:hypothetical protein
VLRRLIGAACGIVAACLAVWLLLAPPTARPAIVILLLLCAGAVWGFAFVIARYAVPDRRPWVWASGAAVAAVVALATVTGPLPSPPPCCDPTATSSPTSTSSPAPTGRNTPSATVQPSPAIDPSEFCRDVRATASVEGRALIELRDTVRVEHGRVVRTHSYNSRRQSVVEAVDASRAAWLQWQENGGSLEQHRDEKVRKWPDDLNVIDDDLDRLDGSEGSRSAAQAWNQLHNYAEGADAVANITCR